MRTREVARFATGDRLTLQLVGDEEDARSDAEELGTIVSIYDGCSMTDEPLWVVVIETGSDDGIQ